MMKGIKMIIDPTISKRSGKMITLVFTIIMVVSGEAISQTTYFDPGFGTSGKVILAVGSEDDIIKDMTLDVYGNIYVCGYASNGADMDFAVAKITPAGALDLTFNGGNVLLVPIGTANDYGTSLVVDGAGNIFVSGSYENGVDDGDLAIIKIKPNGTFDNSFSLDGKAVFQVSTFNDDASTMAMDAAGNLLIGGDSGPYFTIVKVTPAGELDNSFMVGGILMESFSGQGFANEILIKSNGSIYMGCTVRQNSFSFDNPYLSRDHLRLMIIDEDGDYFIKVGTLKMEDCWWCHNTITTMAFDDEENLFVGGHFSKLSPGSGEYSYDNYDGDLIVMKQFANGTKDKDFGYTEKFISPVGSFDDICLDMDIDLHQNIYLAGYVDQEEGIDADFMLVRLRPDGKLDRTFNGDGKFTFPLGSSEDICNSVKTDAQGNVYMAGYSWNGTDYDFAIVKLLQSTLTNLESAAFDPEILVYPNPSKGTLYVDAKEKIEQVTVTNIIGQKEVFYSPSFHTTLSGLIIVEITTDRSVVKKKILVE